MQNLEQFTWNFYKITPHIYFSLILTSIRFTNILFLKKAILAMFTTSEWPNLSQMFLLFIVVDYFEFGSFILQELHWILPNSYILFHETNVGPSIISPWINFQETNFQTFPGKSIKMISGLWRETNVLIKQSCTNKKGLR